MILAPGLDIARGLDAGQVERLAQCGHRPRRDQFVVAIQVGQIRQMPFGRQVGDVAIPVQQVERRIVLAQQVIVGDVIPDQVAPAQQVEGRGHIAAVEIAVGRQRADRVEHLVVDEQVQFAGRLEVDLGGEEGRAGDLGRFLPRREHRQHRGQRRARHAIADGVDARHVQQVADRIDRVDLGRDIIVPDHVLQRCVRRFPRHHEDGNALVHRPADEALLRGQVEDVIAVDPRREDHQRGLQHRHGRGRRLDQLIERRPLHHRARRHRQIAADREGVGVGLGQLAPLQVGHHVLHAVEQILTAGLQRLLDHLRVGRPEIGRAHRIDEALCGELQPLRVARLDPGDLVDRFQHVIGDQEIALANQVEHRIGAPGVVGEALVAGVLRILLRPRRIGVQKPLPQCGSLGPEILCALQRRRVVEAGHDRPAAAVVCIPGGLQPLLHQQLLHAADDVGPMLEVGEGGRGGRVGLIGHDGSLPQAVTSAKAGVSSCMR